MAEVKTILNMTMYGQLLQAGLAFMFRCSKLLLLLLEVRDKSGESVAGGVMGE